ncbi:glycosyltransferase family 2 protein [Vibrio sonorensis]|uniref:glycosyltransferase family 2 protein n=1 Tax=Vibrio sonorensis TaxID=1004316 RepID=UPI0008D94D81|nr:glycosyltransferase family 2 protein [Vibrio sonorensis]
MAINILILAAGQVAFDTHDEGYPLCLTETDGMSLIEKIISHTKCIEDEKHYTYAILERDAEKFHLDKVVQLLTDGSDVVRIPDSTKGSACTALLAASQIDPDSELLIISANELVDKDYSEVISQFKGKGLNGGTLTFKSVHPRYSYIKLNSDDLVVEAAQQMPISKNATAGVFWFRKTSDFVEGAKNMIRKNASVNGNFYVAPVFNELILQQLRIGAIELSLEHYRPIKTERQMQQFEHRG